MSSSPSWSELEQLIVSEMQVALASLHEAGEDEPLAAIVLWADPYKGWYEVLADTASRNREGARARNEEMLRLLPELAARPDGWKAAMTTARRTQALDFDPRYGEYTFADDPIHTFDVSYDELLRSPEYEQLNVGGEDGWLEGHVRFVLAKALARLVADGAFASIPKVSPLRVGYAYPDSSDAIIVALV
ncbi:MAG: hypothetical protein KF901_04935 [Myxococcales bacterium]|nr:hypothetical protein [Myxococcales bacterium]